MSSGSIVVCDLDHTLASCNISFSFGKYLYSRSRLSHTGMAACLFGYFRHKYLNLSVPDLYSAVFHHVCEGKRQSELHTLMAQFYNSSARTRIDWKVHRIIHDNFSDATKILLSSSPDFIVGEFGRQCGFDIWKGTEIVFDLKPGVHRVEQVIDGEAKAEFVRQFAENRHTPLEDVMVLTDSIHDLPMMEIVGKPIGVNPSSRLKKICLARDWEIIRT